MLRRPLHPILSEFSQKIYREDGISIFTAFTLFDSDHHPIALPLPKTGPHRPRLDPTEISVEEPVVQAMLNGSREALGKELSIGGTRYACDSPFYVNEGNIPTLAFGPGTIEQAHTYDEWVDVKQLVDSTKVYALGAMKFLGYS